MSRFSLRSYRSVLTALVLATSVALCGCTSNAQTTDVAAPLRTALDDYIARAEPAYKWEKTSERQIGKNQVTMLQVTSQTWQGIDWKHKVEIVKPEKIDFPGYALLYLSTTDSAFESLLSQSLALQLGAPVVHVMGMPNQPLWGMREDDLIAHSFSKYIETGDATWPLLLPMTKGAFKSMEAVEEYTTQLNQPLNKFIVAGASKRGWTSWLMGSIDTNNRVVGIMPVVYDNLDLTKQLPHQFESWGEFSPMIADYTRRGLQQLLSTPRGLELTRIVDPYTYRARMTLPKLLVNGTNDPYWTTDALNLYWNDLPALKSNFYAPNSGHKLEDNQEKTFATMVAWFRRVAGGHPIPEPQLSVNADDGQAKFTLKVEGEISKAVLWGTHSQSHDFRKSKWQAVPLQNDGNGTYSVNLPTGTDGRKIAAFAEVEVDDKPSVLRLSTPITILDGKPNN
jgi:PhoPQ-activated pathogenicity-related protein